MDYGGDESVEKLDFK